MKKSLRDVLVGQLSGCDHAIEVGVGREPSVTATLAAREVDVITVDVHDLPVPDGASFIRNDVFTHADAADLGPYATTEVVYALNVPVELHHPAAEVTCRTDAGFLSITLGCDEPSVPVSRESLLGETLYVAGRGRRDQRARRDSPGQPQE